MSHADVARPRGGLSRRALARAFGHIDRRIGERVTLDELADAAAVSRFHFSRMFRISTGLSPMDYLLHRRIELAKAMLDSRADAIADIAQSLGFCDQSHFTRRFRRLTGLTPRAYAQRCRTAAGSESPRFPRAGHFAVRNSVSAAIV